MIRHLFSLQADRLSHRERSSAVAERLFDMGYQLDFGYIARRLGKVAAVLECKLKDKGGEVTYSDILPAETRYEKIVLTQPGNQPVAGAWVIVTRSKPAEGLQPSDSIKFIGYDYNLREITTVEQFLAQPHPAPVRAAVARLKLNLKAVFLKSSPL